LKSFEKMTSEKRRTMTEAAGDVFSEAKTRIISVSNSIGDMLSSIGHVQFTKSLNENMTHSEQDKILIERKNDQISAYLKSKLS